MKKKKCIAAGALAAFLLCESLFTPNLAGMGAGLLQVQAAAANVALNKEVTSSANESSTWSADKAVDGDKESDEGRWSSGDMGTNRDNPQWLVIDLAAQKTDVESISVYFNKKAWSTEYQIQTSDSNASDAQWETVYEMSRASADVQRNDPDVIQASALNSSALKRYVRFYFKKGNINGWKCISVREIEIMGTQSGRIETAAGAILRYSGTFPQADAFVFFFAADRTVLRINQSVEYDPKAEKQPEPPEASAAGLMRIFRRRCRGTARTNTGRSSFTHDGRRCSEAALDSRVTADMVCLFGLNRLQSAGQ